MSKRRLEDLCDVEGLCHGYRDEGCDRCSPAIWRLWLLPRLSDREVHEGRKDHANLRRHKSDSANGDRPSAYQGRSLRLASLRLGGFAFNYGFQIPFNAKSQA